MKELYNRDLYLQKIRPFIDKDIIKVIVGQRRVGKSFFLLQIINEIRKINKQANVIYINIEDFEFRMIRNAEDLYNYVASKLQTDKKNYIFIDEIQEVEQFEKTVRSLALSDNNDIYITGSNSNMLSGEIATFLAGRYIEITVYPLSYNEFLQFHKLENTDDSLELYKKYGGLPYLKNLPLKDETAFEYLRSVLDTIIYRDIVSRYKLRNTAFLESLIQFLADNTGSLFAAKNISDYLKSQKINISVTQIQIYLKYLCDAFILNKSEKFDIQGKKIFEVGAKYYFEDLGLRNVITGYRLQDRAKILENMVYNHLVLNGYDVKTGYLKDKEVDFVCKKNNEFVYIQATLSLANETTLQREISNLEMIADNYPKLVVTGEEFTGNTYNGIKIVSLRKFLSSEINL